jgi:hypothetical protein
MLAGRVWTMRDLDDFNTRLDAEFALLPAAIEQKRSDIDREYQGRQQRFVDAFMPAIATLRDHLATSQRRAALAI